MWDWGVLYGSPSPSELNKNLLESCQSLKWTGYQDTDGLRQAIEAGADVNAAEKGWTAYHWACYHGTLDVVTPAAQY